MHANVSPSGAQECNCSHQRRRHVCRLSTGAIVGIVVGVVCGLLLLAVAALLLRRRSRQRRTAAGCGRSDSGKTTMTATSGMPAGMSKAGSVGGSLENSGSLHYALGPKGQHAAPPHSWQEPAKSQAATAAASLWGIRLPWGSRHAAGGHRFAAKIQLRNLPTPV